MLALCEGPGGEEFVPGETEQSTEEEVSIPKRAEGPRM